MTNFLNTEELLGLLKKQEQAPVSKQIKTPKVNRKKLKKIIFYVSLGLAVIHIFMMSLALFLPNHMTNITGNLYVLAVPNDQDLATELDTAIYRMAPFRISRLTTVDRVLIYGKYQTEVYWIEQVLDIDLVNRTIDTTFDGFIRHTYAFEDISGIVKNESNLMGTIIYISSTPRGYVALLMTYFIVFLIIHQTFIKEKKIK